MSTASASNSDMFLGQWDLTEEKPASRVVIELRVSPCDACISSNTCRTQKMACSMFVSWVNHDKVNYSAGVTHFIPSRAKYIKVFGDK